MEPRKITVIQTREQKKSVIMSAATTLGELKRDFDANDIKYDDMSFFEGTAKVELLNDNTPLPHDVPYKGNTTNELVFMLTNSNKKIKSGALSRAELYDIIKSDNLQKTIEEAFGRNYTQVSSVDLADFIHTHTLYNPNPKAHCCKEYTDVVAREALQAVVEFIGDKDLMSDTRISALYKTENKTDNSPYSEEEIEDMFKDI